MEERKQKTIEDENRLKQEAENLKESKNQILNFKQREYLLKEAVKQYIIKAYFKKKV